MDRVEVCGPNASSQSPTSQANEVGAYASNAHSQPSSIQANEVEVNTSAIIIQDNGDVVSDDFVQEEDIHYNDIGDFGCPCRAT